MSIYYKDVKGLKGERSSVDGFELEKVICLWYNSDVLGVQFQSNKPNVIENNTEGQDWK